MTPYQERRMTHDNSESNKLKRSLASRREKLLLRKPYLYQHPKIVFTKIAKNRPAKQSI